MFGRKTGRKWFAVRVTCDELLVTLEGGLCLVVSCLVSLTSSI